MLVRVFAATGCACTGPWVSQISPGWRLQHGSGFASDSSTGSGKGAADPSLLELDFESKLQEIMSQQGTPDAFSTSARPTDASSSSSSSSSSRPGSALQSAADPEHGYAALGRSDAGSEQAEGPKQSARLHPTREFRHGDTYQMQHLSPHAEGGGPAPSWLPPRRRVRYSRGVVVTDPDKDLDFRNIPFLLDCISATGRLRSRRETGLKPRMQVRMARAVQLARRMALLPYDMAVGGSGDTWLKQREYEEARRAAAAMAEQVDGSQR